MCSKIPYYTYTKLLILAKLEAKHGKHLDPDEIVEEKHCVDQ